MRVLTLLGLCIWFLAATSITMAQTVREFNLLIDNRYKNEIRVDVFTGKGVEHVTGYPGQVTAGHFETAQHSVALEFFCGGYKQRHVVSLSPGTKTVRLKVEFNCNNHAWNEHR